ncbi:LacI family transcriptional regulator [Flavobacterium cheongpyeongense]|uniref:LacI family transcriptional regulator n=1 Tax=Flavobacterium cheongpyeongense TaxID=2212651 RepID=A0A2V4BW97_9FLAO|nr:LacI family DNA-binding transcriptional regulator [Flavobacterium cheongpyeongense]PXY42143.1 LacI family transcriptional regulator [Flavobacterium cheongpyeongense]
MSTKRITIYDLAKELGLSVSYVSKALNGKPGVREEIRETVLKKAAELNFKHNTQAANLRYGSSRTLGVIVPQINQSFFSDAISGIEKACTENKHNLIICQSHEKSDIEETAVETLIHQNVDCILISLSKETQSAQILEQVLEHKINVVQFDRCDENFPSHRVINDNKDATYKAAKSMIEEGYQRLAFIGGPLHMDLYMNRKEGFIKAVKEAGMYVPDHFIVNDNISKENAFQTALKLLALPEPPDAFLAISDLQALGIMLAITQSGLKTPQDIGIFGYANEPFTEIITPSISSVDQNSEKMGYQAAMVYFDHILKNKDSNEIITKIIESDLIIRNSSKRSNVVINM